MLDTTTINASNILAPVVYSPEQLAIIRFIDAGKGNLIVRARAGTGKTFLIRHSIPVMTGRVGVAAFGKEISVEVDLKIRQDGNKADVGTFHSFGFRALRRAFPNAKIEGKGPGCAGFKKFDRIAETLEIQNHLVGFVKKATSLAMQRGFGILFPLNDKAQWLDLVAHFNLDEEFSEDNVALKIHGKQHLIETGCRLAAKAVKLGIQQVHEVISFDDMLYAPLVLNLSLPQFDVLAVDEAQDNNALRTEMAARMGKRLIFVGDDKQAIMGFTGADCDSLDQIRVRFNCTVLPMSTTRRCGKAIVTLAQSIVPDYTAHESNPQGQVLAIAEDDFVKFNLVAGEDAIICRNTAPLVKVAYSLIARGVGAHVEGKSIGDGLIAFIDRFKSCKTIVALKDKIAAYLEKETAKLLADKQEGLAETLNDKVETIFSIMETLPLKATPDTLRQDIADLFADTKPGEKRSTVALMTAHRSKGREYKRVFAWGRTKFFPSRFATQEHQLQQESNLEYVMITRAIETYIDVEVA